MNDSFFPSAQEYSKRYGLNTSRLQKLSKNAIVMHPGPMNRGLEISAESADDLKSVIIDQVKNGVAVRMAVLYELLGGAPIGEGR
jgi:aspartate carbamoyltransferase catalytic subunit